MNGPHWSGNMTERYRSLDFLRCDTAFTEKQSPRLRCYEAYRVMRYASIAPSRLLRSVPCHIPLTCSGNEHPYNFVHNRFVLTFANKKRVCTMHTRLFTLIVTVE